MEISICPNCNVRVLPRSDGKCPSCSHFPDTFLPIVETECSHRGDSKAEIDLVAQRSAKPRRTKSVNDYINLGSTIGGLAMGSVILYFFFLGVSIPLGDLGKALLVSIASVLGGICWAEIGLPRMLPQWNQAQAIRAALVGLLGIVIAVTIAAYVYLPG